MRVLVVDDESINRFLLVHMLEEQGYLDIYEARSGHEALLLAEKIKPDLILLDVVMPGMDGLEVATRLKSTNDVVYLPIIFITSLDEKDTVVRCLDVGGDDFVSKPFDKTVVLAKVKAHLRTRELSTNINAQNQELKYFRHTVEREHEIIEHIFSKAIINNPAVTPFFDYRNIPATEFSGDVFLCESSPNGGLYFLIGDFTGHGLASAIGALPVTRAFQAMASKGLSVSEIASTLNRTLENLLPIHMFFAAAIVEVNENGRRFSVWNGGMPDLLLQGPDGQLEKRFSSQHMALGILDNHEFEDDDEVFEAAPGSRILAYTDGLIELTNESGEMFGEVGLEKLFIGNPHISVEDLTAHMRDFMGETEAHDDVTLTLYQCQDLSSLRKDNVVTPLPFRVNVDLGPTLLRSGESIQHFIDLICSQLGLSWIRSDLFTILTELYSNALEHGVLGISSSMKRTSEGFIEYYTLRSERLEQLTEGFVKLEASFDPSQRRLQLLVTDSGKGFDIDNMPEPDPEQSFGRGIAMLNTLCETVEFFNKGTTAKVTLAL
ncbi:fused response regulator/phosphatase [Alteromonas sp. ASW11-36]|uniref:Fused response regulator/phosphatase n=1 Tax=Alteromonas arenosi TaxID=3055817 RepID=A0ABT7SUU9_9ALTE|nr:fused response regulator/phosphatase [Alteromonas sp. ASW11-36]MDM7859963.1 fused response regulator/phosphatase [Alteromonas sp. ASW11-36]